MKKYFSILLSELLLIGILSLPAGADTIRETLTGNAPGMDGYWGQSVVTGNGPGWSNLEFNFYNASGATAWGDIFLLTQEFTGKPKELSNTTAGYLADAAAAGNTWVFDPLVTIEPNMTYWFYTGGDPIYTGHGLAPLGGSGILGGDADVGEAHYYASKRWNVFNGPFTDPGGRQYTLTGTPAGGSGVPEPAVPEPATMLLLGSGLIGLIGFRRRFRKK